MHLRSALSVLNKILEDNRHKQEMDKMEQEMKLELTKQKEELNAQLEEAMEKELEVSGSAKSILHQAIKQLRYYEVLPSGTI